MIRRILNYLRPRPRILIRVLPSRSEADAARIFADWHHSDARLGVILQLVQEHIDAAQGNISAHRYDTTKLTADAGACEALEALLADIVGRVGRVPDAEKKA